MNIDKNFTLFPARKLKPFDGMEVTAEVWDEAHNFHNQALQCHTRLFHGVGILTGLEVLASDPADNLVYLMPGAAVDDLGRLLVLTEPIAYDFGESNTGMLYLTISYREKELSQAPANEEGPRYLSQDFLLTARPSQPGTTQIELARVYRSERNAPIQNQSDALHPKANELDLRFRPLVRTKERQTLSVGVVYTGKGKNRSNTLGLSYLAEELAESSSWGLIISDNLDIGPELAAYALVYLVVDSEVSWQDSQVKVLRSYLDNGGAIFIETGDAAASGSANKLTEALKLNLKPVRKDHALLNSPWHFAKAPEGYHKAGELFAREGAVLSSYNYGRLWAGESADGEPSREDIRAAMELGQNLITFLVNH